MEKISYKGEGRIQACVSVRDYFKLRPVRNKTGVHIKILKKGGLPVRMIRCRKKKAFAAGLLLGSILVIFLSGRIWNIQISGNIKNSTPEILKYLEKEEIEKALDASDYIGDAEKRTMMVLERAKNR